MQLVDNTDFIVWAVTTPNPDHLKGSLNDSDGDAITSETVHNHQFEGAVDNLLLNQWSAMYFYTIQGAKPIETEERLFFALNALFDWRGKIGLEEGINF